MDNDKLLAVIKKDPQLAALYADPRRVVPLSEEEAIKRRQKENIADSLVADNVRRENQAIMNDGLRAAGVNEKVLAKVEALSGLAGPRFLVATLDMSHRLMTVTTFELAAEMDYIKDNYLRNDRLSPEVKSMWQRAYNEIADMIGKNYDRNLSGTQVLAKILGQKKGDDPVKNAKPAFAPLTR